MPPKADLALKQRLMVYLHRFSICVNEHMWSNLTKPAKFICCSFSNSTHIWHFLPTGSTRRALAHNMLLTGSDSIRDVIAFPKTSSASDPMTGAPSEVTGKQLKEVNLRLL